MSEKRKDKKGRILKDGESQRSNGSYQFRYTDVNGKRKNRPRQIPPGTAAGCPVHAAGSARIPRKSGRFVSQSISI